MADAGQQLVAIHATGRRGYDVFRFRDTHESDEGDRMMEQARIASLRAQHSAIDRRIAAESQRPAADNTLIARMKKIRLKLKEAIAGA